MGLNPVILPLEQRQGEDSSETNFEVKATPHEKTTF